MRDTARLVLLASVAGASALQIPFLLGPLDQAPIRVNDDVKPLVNSSALQDLNSGDRLMRRAKELYEIAKLGEPEYNRKTSSCCGMPEQLLTPDRSY